MKQFADLREREANHRRGSIFWARWTRVDISGGFDVLETDNPKALRELALVWCDLMELSIVCSTILLRQTGMNVRSAKSHFPITGLIRSQRKLINHNRCIGSELFDRI